MIEVGFTLSVMLVGVASSSVSVMLASAKRSVLAPMTLPLTVRVWSVSSTTLFTGVSVNISVADCAPAGMVIVNGLTAAMST